MVLAGTIIEATIVDVVDAKVEKAQNQFPSCSFEVKNCLYLNENNQYGLILCSEVLQHIVDYRKCLNAKILWLEMSYEFLMAINEKPGQF